MKITEYGPGVTATVQPSGSSYSTFSTAPFTLPSGGYTLTFQGLNPNGGNNVALIDSVTLNGTLVANGSFESPSLTPPSLETDPTGTAWSYAGSSGIATNGSTLTSNNPSAPDGSQVAFIQNNGLLSQIWSVSAGTYTLSFKAAQSGNGNNSYQQVRVNVRPSGSVISAKTFVLSGNAIAEERDSTGATVTKRFFAEGEQRIGSGDAGNYYYTRDHLGSVREVTDSSGNLVGQYDYDAWGNEAVVNGNMTVDFGYTGHYFHQPSGLNLSLRRFYNPSLARWMSRDPLKDAEMSQGPNLYWYVGDDPINVVDPLGLRDYLVGIVWREYTNASELAKIGLALDQNFDENLANSEAVRGRIASLLNAFPREGDTFSVGGDTVTLQDIVSARQLSDATGSYDQTLLFVHGTTFGDQTYAVGWDRLNGFPSNCTAFGCNVDEGPLGGSEVLSDLVDNLLQDLLLDTLRCKK